MVKIVLILLMLSGVLVRSSNISPHHHALVQKDKGTIKKSKQVEQHHLPDYTIKSEVVVEDSLHTGAAKSEANESPKRNLFDALKNANISVQNSVHSVAVRSDIKNAHSEKRDFWHSIKNANISVENHVNSYSVKSNVGRATNSDKRNIWDTLKNANISVQNSVHSTATLKSEDPTSKKDTDLPVARKSEVILPDAIIPSVKGRISPVKLHEKLGQKRDEEPTQVTLEGRSPTDVAEAIEDNDKTIIPLLEKQHYKEMKDAKHTAVEPNEPPEYVISDQGDFPAEDDPYYFSGKHRGHDRGETHSFRSPDRYKEEERPREGREEYGRYNDRGGRLSHLNGEEEGRDRNAVEDDDRMDGGRARGAGKGDVVEYFDKGEQSKEDDEYSRHGLHESNFMEDGRGKPDQYEERMDRFDKENNFNDDPGPREGEEMRKPDDGDWEPHENSEGRSHRHPIHPHFNGHGRFPPPNRRARLHANRGGEEEQDYHPMIHRIPPDSMTSHNEDLPTNFEGKHPPDDFINNAGGGGEHFDQPMDAGAQEEEAHFAAVPKPPCEKKRNGICDEIHDNSPPTQLNGGASSGDKRSLGEKKNA